MADNRAIQYFVTDDRMLREKKHLDPDDLVQIHLLEHTGPVVFISCQEFKDKILQGMQNPQDTTPTPLNPLPLGAIPITSVEQFMSMAKSGNKIHEAFYSMLVKLMTREQAARVKLIRQQWGYTWRSVARYCSTYRSAHWGSWSPVSNQLIGMAICRRAAEIYDEDYMKPPWN